MIRSKRVTTHTTRRLAFMVAVLLVTTSCSTISTPISNTVAPLSQLFGGKGLSKAQKAELEKRKQEQLAQWEAMEKEAEIYQAALREKQDKKEEALAKAQRLRREASEARRMAQLQLRRERENRARELLAQQEQRQAIQNSPVEEPQASIANNSSRIVPPRGAELSIPGATLMPAVVQYPSPTPTPNFSDRNVEFVDDQVEVQLVEVVDDWRNAWSNQNVEKYLSYYSRDFAPPNGQSRRDWEALRTSRLTKPKQIDVDIDFRSFKFVETNIVQVHFQQRYQSDVYGDVVDKVLTMQHKMGVWKIISEQT